MDYPKIFLDKQEGDKYIKKTETKEAKKKGRKERRNVGNVEQQLVKERQT